MNNLYSKEEFLFKKESTLNEGLFDFLKNVWKSVTKLYGKIKGSKELQNLFDKYSVKIDEVFKKMEEAELSKSAKKANVSSGINEEVNTDIAGLDTQKEEEVKPATPNNQNKKEQGLSGLNKNQLNNLIKISQKRIGELGKQFEEESNEILRRFTSKEGVVSGKLKQLLIVMKHQLKDKIYSDWVNFYEKVGNKKELVNYQKARQKTATEYKKDVEELKNLVNKKVEKQFKVGQKYEYTTKKGDKSKIEILSLDNDGNVSSVKNEKGTTFNPISSKIGDEIKEKSE